MIYYTVLEATAINSVIWFMIYHKYSIYSIIYTSKISSLKDSQAKKWKNSQNELISSKIKKTIVFSESKTYVYIWKYSFRQWWEELELSETFIDCPSTKCYL